MGEGGNNIYRENGEGGKELQWLDGIGLVVIHVIWGPAAGWLKRSCSPSDPMVFVLGRAVVSFGDHWHIQLEFGRLSSSVWGLRVRALSVDGQEQDFEAVVVLRWSFLQKWGILVQLKESN